MGADADLIRFANEYAASAVVVFLLLVALDTNESQHLISDRTRMGF